MARNVSRRGFIQGLAALGAGAKTGALGQMAGKALESAAPTAVEAIAKPVSNDMVAAIGNFIPKFDEWRPSAHIPEHVVHMWETNSDLTPQLYEAFVRDAAKDWVTETGGAIPKADVDHFLRTVPAHQITSYLEHHYTTYLTEQDGHPKHVNPLFETLGPDEQLKYDIPGMTPEQVELLHDHSGLRDMLYSLHDEAVNNADEFGWPMPKGATELREEPGYPVDHMDQIRRLIQNDHPDAAGHLARLVSDDMPSVGDVLKHLFPDEAERVAVSEKLTTAPQITDQRAVPMEPARDPVPVKRQQEDE